MKTDQDLRLVSRLAQISVVAQIDLCFAIFNLKRNADHGARTERGEILTQCYQIAIRTGRALRPAETKGGINMAVTEAEVRTLQPGDKIVVISEEEAKAKGYWDNYVSSWAGSYRGARGAKDGMNKYCGKELAVCKVDPRDGRYTKAYVKENGFWWRDSFIAAIIRQEMIEPLEPEAIEAMLFGGA